MAFLMELFSNVCTSLNISLTYIVQEIVFHLLLGVVLRSDNQDYRSI